MHNDDLRDDLPIGRLLTRREALALIGGIGCWHWSAEPSAAHAATDAIPGCVVRPAQTEGPFFVEGELERSDIRFRCARGQPSSRDTAYDSSFNVARIGGGVVCRSGGAGSRLALRREQAILRQRRTPRLGTSRQFLRGYQLTDAAGAAKFLTIFPGMVRWQDRTHPLQDPACRRPGFEHAQPGVHVAALLRRCVGGSRVLPQRLRQPWQARRA